ncbi:Splicing factor 3B subunit 2, partial [Borealophlyctis nickersoniae]
VPSGLETPEYIELRKDVRRGAVDEEPKQLYTVLPQRDANVKGFMGSTHVYDVSAATSGGAAAAAPEIGTRKRKLGAGVDIALNPEDLEEGLDANTIQRKYEQQVEADKGDGGREDMSDMVAEHARAQDRKRVKRDEGKKKKDKEFKF